MVEKWKLALKEFLKKYEEDDDVVGAILCGSYANETYNDSSDINVYLVLKNSVKETEEGNTESNSYLISYSKKNSDNIKKLMNIEYEATNNLIVANMFAYGKIIYDLDGSVKELQDLALDYIDRPLRNINATLFDLNNRFLAISMIELTQALKEQRLDFNTIYYDLLRHIYIDYCEYEGVPMYQESKIYKILTDEEYRKKSHIFKVPDNKFVKLYLNCYEIDKANVMYKNIKKLLDYYYERVGGFNIRNYKMVTEI